MIRHPLVDYLAGEGMSTRAIAPIVGTSHMQVKRDIDAGVTNVTPEPPAPEFVSSGGFVAPIVGVHHDTVATDIQKARVGNPTPAPAVEPDAVVSFDATPVLPNRDDDWIEPDAGEEVSSPAPSC